MRKISEYAERSAHCAWKFMRQLESWSARTLSRKILLSKSIFVFVDFYIHLKFIIYLTWRVLRFFSLSFSFLILTISLPVFMLVLQSCVCSAVASIFLNIRHLTVTIYFLITAAFSASLVSTFRESHYYLVIIEKKTDIFGFCISGLTSLQCWSRNRSSINIAGYRRSFMPKYLFRRLCCLSNQNPQKCTCPLDQCNEAR